MGEREVLTDRRGALKRLPHVLEEEPETLIDDSEALSAPISVRAVADRIVDFQESIEVDVALALGPLLLWLAGGMIGSTLLQSMAHLAIIGLLLVVPRAGMLAMIPLLPFEHLRPFPPHGPIMAEAIAIAISITLRAGLGGIQVPAIARPAVWLAVGLLVATVFQTTLGLRVFGGTLPLSLLSDMNQVVIILVVFVGSVVFLRPDGVVPALVAYLVSFVVVAGVGILHFARPGILDSLDLAWMVSPFATASRATGAIPNANFMGFFIGMGLAWLIIIMAWYVWHGRMEPVVAAVVPASVGIVALLLTLSRTSIAAAGLGVVFAATRLSFKAAAGMLLAGALVALLAYPVFVNLRLGQTFGSAGSAGQAALAGSDDLRAGQAVAAFHAFVDSPILGHGFGTFTALSPKYTHQSVLTSAHNAYLKLAAEQGVVGLGLFLAFLAAIAVPLWRARPGPWTAGLAVIGVIAVFSLTGDSLSTAQAIASGFVVLAAMLVAADADRDPFARSEVASTWETLR